ncbi:MAG: phage major capsid protein, partial [Planctomycetaceae bacterium]
AQIDEVTAESTNSTDPTLALLQLGLYQFSSKFVRLANSILDNSSEMATIIGAMLALRLVKIMESKATNGAGTTTPRGILLDVASGVVMADAAVISWEEVKRLKYSVDQIYRSNGQFMLNDDTLAEYMLLKDANDRPLLTEANGDDPPRLIGRPYIINNFYPTVDTVADEAPLVTFGNHKAYKAKMSSTTRIERARERFIEFNQTAYIGFRGFDGALQTVGNQVKALFTPAGA